MCMYGYTQAHCSKRSSVSCTKSTSTCTSVTVLFKLPLGLLAAGRDVDSPLSSFTITLLKLRVIGRNEFLAHLIRWRRCLQICQCLKLNVRGPAPNSLATTVSGMAPVIVMPWYGCEGEERARSIQLPGNVLHTPVTNRQIRELTGSAKV